MELRIPQNAPPKAVPDWQYYMREHRQEIQDVYNERETTAAKTGIALRSLIAKELVDMMGEEERKLLADAANADYQQRCNKYKDAARGDPSSDPEVQLE